MMIFYQSQNLLSKVFYYAVALVRKQSGSTSRGFLVAILEMLFNFVLMGIIMFFMGRIGLKINGDFGFYVLSGIGFFLLHNKIVMVVASSSASDKMMPILAISRGVMIAGGLLHGIFMTFIAIGILVIGCYLYYGDIPLQDGWGLLYCLFLMFIWSMSAGFLFMSIMPLSPMFVKRLLMIYTRLGMVTSGKMIPGNTLGVMGKFGGLFLINPVFHIIDQARGFIFINYYPHVSNLEYPLVASFRVFIVALVLYLVIGRKK